MADAGRPGRKESTSRDRGRFAHGGANRFLRAATHRHLFAVRSCWARGIPRRSSEHPPAFSPFTPPPSRPPASRDTATAHGTASCIERSGFLAGEQAHRRCPALGQRAGLVGVGLLLQVIENPLDHHRVLDAGHDLHGPAAGRTGLDVNIENTFQALRPAHRCPAFGGRSCLLGVAAVGAPSLGEQERADCVGAIGPRRVVSKGRMTR